VFVVCNKSCCVLLLLLTSATRGGNVMIVMTLPPLVPTNVDITVSPVWQDVTYTFLTSRLAETVLLVVHDVMSDVLLSVAKLSLSVSLSSLSQYCRA
jgi:hypothetical protein